MNKVPGFDLVERARALQPLIAREANEIERTRRLTQPVVSALIENGLYRALAAEKPRRRRGAARDLHADAGGDRQGRCLDRMVPRPVQRLRHGLGLYRSRTGQRDFQRRARHPRLGRDRPYGAGGSRRLQGQRALGFRQRLAAGELARRPCPDRRGRRLAAPQARRLAGDPHHPVPDDQRHDVRRLGRDRPQRHRHRLLFGRGPLHSGAIHRAARRTRGVARERPALPDPHPNGLQHGLWRHLARRRPRHAGCRHRAVARQAAAGTERRCARTTRCRA